MNLFHNIYAGQNLILYTLSILQFCQLHNLRKVEKKKCKLKQFFVNNIGIEKINIHSIVSS